MLILEHLERLQRLTGVEFKYITPVEFGYAINWTAATVYILASCFIPKQQSLIVLRVEQHINNLTTQKYEPPPPGTANWLTSATLTNTGENETNPDAPVHLVCDVDTMLIFGGNQYASLVGDLNANPDSGTVTRSINTTVYAYFVPADIAERLKKQFQFINVQM